MSVIKAEQIQRRVLKDSKIADMVLFPYRLFFIALPPLVVSKCARAGVFYKPPSEREVAREA